MKPTHRLEEARAVAAILERIPELLTVKQVRRRDGSVVPFAVERVGMTFSSALKDEGMGDDLLLARCTHQALTQLSRAFASADVPTTDDLDRIAAAVLIANNLPFAAKRLLDAGVVVAATVVPGFVAAATVPGTTAGTPPASVKAPRFHRRHTRHGVEPLEQAEWTRRDAVITDDKGRTLFEQRGVEAPASWSQGAVTIAASKYFHGALGASERETSVRQLVRRVAGTVAGWARDDGRFASAEDAATFEAELSHLLVSQKAAFNSPVWRNVGIAPRPQILSCYINAVRDDVRSVLSLVGTEGLLLEGGFGAGANLSAIRSSKEAPYRVGGRAVGPVALMKGFDAFAGAFASGGKGRRASKAVILNADHPDIEEFVASKAGEDAPFFRHANHAVRVTDDFMQSVTADGEWETKAVTTGETVGRLRSRGLLDGIAKAAWASGDPGLQFDTTINRWNTVSNSGRLNAANPCGDFQFLDDSSCGLAALNLLKFRRDDGSFDVPAFMHAVEIMTTALDVTISRSGHPTPIFEERSLDFRPLGLGHVNLGALLAALGLAYDSDEARNVAAAITALLSGHAYDQSAKMAEAFGPCRAYALNEKPFLKTIGLHRDRAYAVPAAGVPADLLDAARRAWDNALEHGMTHGFRNAQVSMLGPANVFGMLMDADTTGIEPDDAIPAVPPVSRLRMAAAVQPFLSGAVSLAVPLPSTATPEDVRELFVEAWKAGVKTITVRREGAGTVTAASVTEHTSHSTGPVNAATPPVLGQALRAVGVPAALPPVGTDFGVPPSSATAHGASALTGPAESLVTAAPAPASAPIQQTRIEYRPLRRRLPDERRSMTHKFSVGGHEGYVTVGLYDDGEPGELFIRMAKGGTVVSGLMDAFATSTSIALQYGVPLKVLVNKFVHVRFEPSGYTSHPNIRVAKSIVDYLFRWMALKFLSVEEQRVVGVNMDEPTLADAGERDVAASAATPDEPVAHAVGIAAVSDANQMRIDDAPPAMPASAPTVPAPAAAEAPAPRPPQKPFRSIADGIVAVLGSSGHVAPASASAAAESPLAFDVSSDAPACDTCGAIMIRNASCYKCLNCGAASGCS